MKKKNILITGGLGLLGRSLIKKLLKEKHSIYVIDIQDGGGWDWSQGEPPEEDPAYYLRYNKTFSRMGGTMQYLQADNRDLLLGLVHGLKQ